MVRVLGMEAAKVGPVLYAKRRILARVLSTMVQHMTMIAIGWTIYYYPKLLSNNPKLIGPITASWVTMSVNAAAKIPWMVVGKWLRKGKRVPTEVFIAACKPAISIEAHVTGGRRICAVIFGLITFLWLYVPDQIVSVSITEAREMAIARQVRRIIHTGPIGGGTNTSGNPSYDISGLQMLAEDDITVDAAVFVAEGEYATIPLSPQEASTSNTTYYRLSLKDWPGIRLKTTGVRADVEVCKTEDEAEKFEFAMGSATVGGKLIHTVQYDPAGEQGRSGKYEMSVEVQRVRMDVKFTWSKDRVVIKRISNVREEAEEGVTDTLLKNARTDMCKAFANVVHYGTKRDASLQVLRTHVATIVRTGTGETWTGFGSSEKTMGLVDEREPGIRAASSIMFIATSLSVLSMLLAVVDETMEKLDSDLMSICSNMSGLVDGRRLCAPRDVRTRTGARQSKIGWLLSLEIALQGRCQETGYEVGHIQLTDGIPRRNTPVVVDLRGRIRIKTKRKKHKARRRMQGACNTEKAADLSGLVALSISRLSPDRYKGREHEAIRLGPQFRKLARPEHSNVVLAD
uniref:Uncharacterized protein n=1 Tax=Red algae totivirus 1 TaxID=2706914 RepID=A0A6J4BUL0_9VIRU|nr:hypothetical protein [Red algae totivirus 1]